MIRIEKNSKPTKKKLDCFLEKFDFIFPVGFIKFYTKANGGYIYSNERYIHLYDFNDMILYKIYSPKYSELVSKLLIFASDGGEMCYLINKNTGYIYEAPFIGGEEYLTFVCKTFTDFLEVFPLISIDKSMNNMQNSYNKNKNNE